MHMIKAVILAGGLGTRISEETHLRPKPMVEIGGKPILWHIMKMYSNHGVNEFIVCCGYMGYVIKEYFANYFLHHSDLTFDIKSNTMKVHNSRGEDWKITLVDTGDDVMTGGRLLAVADYLVDEKMFCLTYGDGVSDIDITNTIDFHVKHGKKATVAAVYPPGRFGALEISGDNVEGFSEKPRGDGSFVNGGFFVLSPDVLALLDGPKCVWEKAPLESLALCGELKAYKHDGFWQPMDTLRDKQYLEQLWSKGDAPWKTW